MYFFKNPGWIDKRMLSAARLENIPESIFEEINHRLVNLLSDDPLVSVVIPAYNEELNVLRTIHSLANNKTTFPVEIIVVNNNSTDRTQMVLDRLKVRSYFQPRAGCGPARQMGQQNAKGKYILMADADCYYPPRWIHKMTEALQRDGTPCIYGRYSFLGTPDKPRWKLFLYESLRDGFSEIRHIKRPCVNALGMSMGYVKELGVKTGFVDRKIRGEDGRLCFQLMQYGKIRQVRDRSVRVWTLPRTLDKEPGLLYSAAARIVIELTRLTHYFSTQKQHDVTKTNPYVPPSLKYFRKFKSVHKEDADPVEEKQA